MYAGRIVEEGPADDGASAIRGTRTRRPSPPPSPRSATSDTSRRPPACGGDPPDPSALPSGCTFHPRCAEAIARCGGSTRRCTTPARTGAPRASSWTRPPRPRSRGSGSVSECSPGRGADRVGGPRRSSRSATCTFVRGPRDPCWAGGNGSSLGPWTAWTSRSDAGRSWRSPASRVRQDHARAVDHGIREARCGRDPLRGRAAGQDLRAHRRKVQMVYQDPTGALNPRQTIYDSVAEGLRIHRRPRRDEQELVAAGARAGRAATTGALLPAVPARAVRRSATARRDRRSPCARAAGDRGR